MAFSGENGLPAIKQDSNVTCSSSYSVDDGLTWTEIYESYPVNISGNQKQHQIVRTALGEDADDVEFLSIELSQGNKVQRQSIDFCYFDEIRICGTLITSPPSSAPTESTDNPSTSPSKIPTEAPTEAANDVRSIGIIANIIVGVFMYIFIS
eukprot:UN03388